MANRPTRRPTERKSSKLRIGAATVCDAALKFTPSADGWEQIERAYDREFEEHDRSEIRKIVDRFLDWRRFEKAAPFVDDVTSPVRNTEKALGKLNRAFSDLFDRRSDAAFHARTTIEQAWRGADGLGPDKLMGFYSSACGLVLACTDARKMLKENAGAREGQAWELMIRQLAEFALEHGLSTTSRKDTDKQKGKTFSPFVAFVKAIQDQFPSDVPVRFSTEIGLARAISLVLRPLRRSGIDLKRDPPKQIPHLG